MPGSDNCKFPTVMASEATTKNQPPDIDIIVFQIRPGIAKGTSTRQKRCQAEKRKPRLASSRSVGIVRNDWKKLNVIFHAWLVKIAKIAASSAPNCLVGDSETKKTTVNDK